MKATIIFRIFALILLLALLLSLGACNKQAYAAYTALEVSNSSDAFDEGTHTREYALWNSENTRVHADEAAPQTATVTFNGSTYTGTYLDTILLPPSLYKVHEYKGDKVLFDLHAETGELVSIMFTDAITETSGAKKFTEEDCRSIAEGIAKQYINLADYQLDISTSDFLCAFTYYREINGLPTNDKLNVVISRLNGNISSFDISALHSFKKRVRFNYDEAKAIAAMEQKLDAIYQNDENYDKENRDYEIWSKTLILLEDGTPALFYVVDVDILYPAEENTFHSGGGLLNIIVTLPRK